MDIKTQKMLADVITDAQKNAVKPYTTTAKVKGVSNGVAYVEIPGSDRLTPVKNSSVAVKKGDIIDLVVSHEDTHITGNRSDVATPQSSTKELSKAMEATRLELDNKLDLTNNKIKMVGNDIEMIDNTITQQGNTITEINNTIDSQNNTITQQGNKIVEINNAVTEVNNKVESQNNTITQIGNTVDQQNNTITEMNNKIDSQNNTIKEMDNTITSQGNTITQLDNKVTSQGNTITQQGNTITEMNSAIETLDSTVKTQGSSIETLDSSVKIVNSAFIIQNGKLTGISEILTNILDSDYVTTDLLNANVAWIENGKIKEGAIGTVEIHDSSITTAKIAELSADVIKTGTLKTECLILTTDEVDPKTGEKKVALITALNAKTKAGEGNLLDGAIVKDGTIEAAKITVVDLNAFGATIGNFHIGTSSIYNNKTALTDPTDGVYIGTDGIALGQGSLLNMTDDSPFRVESDGDFHLGGKNSNYVNFNAFSGKLDINAENIKIGSSSIATIDDTKNAIASSVEGIVVGGKNLLLNSNFELPGNPNWSGLSASAYITNEGRNGGYCAKQIGEFNKDHSMNNIVDNGYEYNKIKTKANDVFTFSGWYKVQDYVPGTTNNYVRPYVAYYKSDGSWVTETAILDISPDATDWTYVQATFKVPNTSNIDYMVFTLYARDYTGIIWWGDIKLEKGNKATDWSPAPEDIEKTSKSYTDQKADEISQVVSQKVGADEIISKINQTAETITIDASKLNLNGYVTIKNLKDSGATEINGANIITKSIDANKINVVDLSALNATIGGFSITETGISKTYNKDSSIISGKQDVYELEISSYGAPYFRSAKHEWKVAEYVYNKEMTCDGDLMIEYDSRYDMNGSIFNRQTIELKADWSYPGLYITHFTKSGTQKNYRTIYRDTGFGRWKYTNGISDGVDPMYCSSPFAIGSDRNASLTNFDLRVSSSDGNHMNLGQRTIQAVNKDDAATTLYLNSYGGSVSIGSVGGAGTTTLNANVSFEKKCSYVTTTSPNNSILYGILMNGGQFVAVVFRNYRIHSVDPWGVIVQENLMPANSNAKDVALWHNLTTGRGEAVRVAFNPYTGNIAVNAQYNTLTNDNLNGIAIFPVLQ